MNRRNNIKSLSALALYPFLEINAADKPTPKYKRAVFVSVPFGMIDDYFRPNESGRKYQSPQVLSEIDSLRDDFTIFSNLEHSMGGNGHAAVKTFLNGVNKNTSQFLPNKNETIDQAMARQLRGLTRFPSLNLGYGGGCQTSWTRNGMKVRAHSDEASIFKNLFKPLSTSDRENLDSSLSGRLEMLNVLHKQQSLFKSDLGRRDQEKLDEFNTAIHELNREIALEKEWTYKDKPKVDIKGMQNSSTLLESLPRLFELGYLSLFTNSTRVLVLETNSTPNLKGFDISGSYHSNSHHGKKPEFKQNMGVIESFYLRQLKIFIEKLKNTPDPEGEGTMLDNTMVLYGSGMSNSSNHSSRNLPLLLAGGGFSHGRHIKYSKPTEMANLLLTIGQKMGLEMDEFQNSNGTLEI